MKENRNSGQGRFQAILGSVSGSATEHTEVVFETALTFLRGELSVLPSLLESAAEFPEEAGLPELLPEF